MRKNESTDLSKRLHKILKALEAGAEGTFYNQKKSDPKSIYERVAILEVAAPGMTGQRNYWKTRHDILLDSYQEARKQLDEMKAKYEPNEDED